MIMNKENNAEKVGKLQINCPYFHYLLHAFLAMYAKKKKNPYNTLQTRKCIDWQMFIEICF